MARPTNQSESESISDRSIIDYLRRHTTSSISELVEFAGVTATAIRQRVNRLMEQGLVVRHAESAGRGRPTHRYALSPAGKRVGGDNYEDLAQVLWSELRSIKDPKVRSGLLARVVGRLSEKYEPEVHGESLSDKIESLSQFMQERDIPFEIDQKDGELPILTALACPYPDLAEEDRGICSMEKMLFSTILGENVKLTACRLDGDDCCTFETGNNRNPMPSGPGVQPIES